MDFTEHCYKLRSERRITNMTLLRVRLPYWRFNAVWTGVQSSTYEAEQRRILARTFYDFEMEYFAIYSEIPSTPSLEICRFGHGERRREARKEVAVVLSVGHALRAH
jgi:hypothetical protein